MQNSFELDGTRHVYLRQRWRLCDGIAVIQNLYLPTERQCGCQDINATAREVVYCYYFNMTLLHIRVDNIVRSVFWLEAGDSLALGHIYIL